MSKGTNSRKRALSLAVLFLTCFLLIGAVSAKDVAYIYKNKNRIDNNFINLFSEMGLSVDTIQENQIIFTDFSQYRLIFVGDERFTNPNLIPVGQYPTIVTNYYYGYQWGLTDKDGISELARTEPLSVRINNTDQVVQVYTEAMFDMSGVAIPYYYLANGDKAPGMTQVAGTYSGNGYNLGDVISYANKGVLLKNGKTTQGRLCFFGLVESKYWTDDARQMAKDCLGYVGVTCFENSDCGEDTIGELYCKDGNVYQDTIDPICNNPGTIFSECGQDVTSDKIKTCEFGCENGECKPECTLYDLTNCGAEAYSDNYCKDGNVVKDHTTPSCSLTDTCLNNTITETIDTCPFGCENGECIVQCSKNSDCGTDGLLNQPYCKDNKVYDKEAKYTCNSPGTKNSFCANATTEKLIETCSDKCLNGQCVTIVCSKDSDCDDNNSHTEDKCLNPGTVQSSCQNKLIKCLNNAECGTDGFLGQLFCKNDNIFDKYKTYTCLNAGTSSSSCTSSTEDKLTSECPYKCANAQCVRCSLNSDCDDNNPGTQDTCLNPGTPQSSCQNTPIKCSKNSDCGTDGFTGNKYCLGGDSYEDFITYTCNNPNTGQSSCTSLSKPVLKQVCEADCLNGACIACFGDSDCGSNGFTGSSYCSGKNIFQDYKTYTCLNPGTTQSSCSDSTDNKLKQTCPGVCFKGQCKDVKCNSDSDCDDNDEYTLDQCNNPGTSSSYCSHTQYNCVSDSDCGITGFSGEEFCMINNIFKMQYASKCVNPATTMSYCDNSVTQKLIVDCGKDSCDSYGSDYCKNGNVYHSRTCYDKGCANQACFSTPSNDESLVQSCSYGCSNGACNPIPNNQCVDNDHDSYDTCNPGQPGDDGKPVDCNDNNPNVHPGATEVCNGIDDNCNGLIDENNGNCPAGQVCQNGQCLIVHCNNNADCDDANAHTYDQCLNPGTPQSTCTHTPILCLNNAECGTDGYLNQLFCLNNNVYDKYKTYTCLNAGTTQSSCTNSLSDVLKQICPPGNVCGNGMCVPVTCDNNNDCGTDHDLNQLFCQNNNVYDKHITFTCLNPETPQSTCTSSLSDVLKQTCTQNQICSNGVCNPINIPCSSDAQCNDANVHTYDQCINPGTPQSFCSHIPIVCLNNAECGTDGFINGLFCQSGNVFQNYVTYTCNNPGTIQSSCSAYAAPQLKQTCAYGCSNGVCNPNTCVDNDKDGYDTCNPGQPGDDGKPVDCNDNNPNVHPGATEICNGIDDNCNGQIDEGGVCVCSQNSDCGTDHDLNQLFCKDGNVFDKHIAYTCLNPLNPLNACSSSTSDVLKQTCGSGGTSEKQTHTFSESEIRHYSSVSECNGCGDSASLGIQCNGNWYGYCATADTAKQFCIEKGYEGYEGNYGTDYIGPVLYNDLILDWKNGNWVHTCGTSCSNVISSITCVKNVNVSSTCSNGVCVPVTPIPCQSTFTFNNGDEIRDFVNSLGIYNHIPDNADLNGGQIKYNDASALKVCQLKGYTSVKSKTLGHWYSCGDNTPTATLPSSLTRHFFLCRISSIK